MVVGIKVMPLDVSPKSFPNLNINSEFCRSAFGLWPNDYLLTYLLTPWSRVLLQKLASLQLVKKFAAFYGTRRFLTALTSARHLYLSWASPIHSSYPPHTSVVTGGYFSGLKRPGREVGYCDLYSAKLENEWRYYLSSCDVTWRGRETALPLPYVLKWSDMCLWRYCGMCDTNKFTTL